MWKDGKYIVEQEKKRTICSKGEVDKFVNKVIHNLWITMWKKAFSEKNERNR